MLKILRVSILLFVLVSVALATWRARTHSVEWKYTLPVNIYLINGDTSAVSADYLRSLTADDFKPVETFMRDEANRYGRSGHASIEIRLGGVIDTQPPQPPHNGSALEVVAWSLKMRWWAYRNADTTGPGPQVKMFLLYFDPAQNRRLAHSTGLQKGLIGRVNVFASRDMAKQNNVVIAHEFLHTLGATDKYDPATNQPFFPDGYAEPDLWPTLPQRYGEIMAGRTPLTQTEAVTPASLDDALIGSKTAQEINWLATGG
ncbi:MAG: hypothetical protein HY938_06715 [Nitrosomonadales bacterium]|nr:hypothetical protein [Nitrosomonadales bacterium]